MLDSSSLEQALGDLGAVLAQRGARHELVAVGGSNLLLLGLSVRPTRDLDVLAVIQRGALVTARPLPPDLATAAREVGALYGFGPDWLNAGPTAQLDSGLPAGFLERTEIRRYGGLILRLAGRLDMVCLKLHAAVDAWPRPSKHLDDLRRLAPDAAEPAFARRWVAEQDVSEPFQQLLGSLLAELGAADAP